MNLTFWEFKKIWKTSAVKIAAVLLFLVNLYSLLLGSQPGVGKAGQSPFDTDIQQLQENGAEFAGEINEDWHKRHMAGSTAEQGTEDYQKYEDVEFAAAYYVRAKESSDWLAKGYRESYPGKKGEVLAAETERLYQKVEEYTVYYNYDWGWWKLRNIHTTYPMTIGVFLLIALAPLFSSEYALKTDALVLSSKYGKRRLILGKLKAGLLLSLLAWAAVELTNILLIGALYGYTGGEAYWQNWLTDWAPFLWNQWQVTLVTVLTSLLGTLFLCGVLMAVSACVKNQFVSLALGGTILLVPCLNYAIQEIRLVQRIFSLFPAKLIVGISEWQAFDLCYLFGRAVPIQYLIIPTVLLLWAGTIVLSYTKFRKHQVEN